MVPAAEPQTPSRGLPPGRGRNASSAAKRPQRQNYLQAGHRPGTDEEEPPEMCGAPDESRSVMVRGRCWAAGRAGRRRLRRPVVRLSDTLDGPDRAVREPDSWRRRYRHRSAGSDVLRRVFRQERRSGRGCPARTVFAKQDWPVAPTGGQPKPGHDCLTSSQLAGPGPLSTRDATQRRHQPSTAVHPWVVVPTVGPAPEGAVGAPRRDPRCEGSS